MRIAILGAGAIGSTFAFHLSRAGHDVAVLARGARLAKLIEDAAIVARGLGAKGGEGRAKVHPMATLEPDDVYDLVLVTVLASQVDALMPAIAANRSPAVMFMFNTFGGLAALREAVGRERFSWGFPAIVAHLDASGTLEARVVPRAASMLQITTLGALADHAPDWIRTWAETFSRAGIPTIVHPDMASWLGSHAAFMVPLMVTGVRAYEAKRGLPWGEALEIAEGMRAGFALVRRSGMRVTPGNIALLSHLPAAFVAGGLWLASRLSVVRALGANGKAEPRALVLAMLKLDPESEALRRLLL